MILILQETLSSPESTSQKSISDFFRSPSIKKPKENLPKMADIVQPKHVLNPGTEKKSKNSLKNIEVYNVSCDVADKGTLLSSKKPAQKHEKAGNLCSGKKETKKKNVCNHSEEVSYDEFLNIDVKKSDVGDTSAESEAMEISYEDFEKAVHEESVLDERSPVKLENHCKGKSQEEGKMYGIAKFFGRNERVISSDSGSKQNEQVNNKFEVKAEVHSKMDRKGKPSMKNHEIREKSEKCQTKKSKQNKNEDDDADFEVSVIESEQCKAELPKETKRKSDMPVKKGMTNCNKKTNKTEESNNSMKDDNNKEILTQKMTALNKMSVNVPNKCTQATLSFGAKGKLTSVVAQPSEVSEVKIKESDESVEVANRKGKSKAAVKLDMNTNVSETSNKKKLKKKVSKKASENSKSDIVKNEDQDGASKNNKRKADTKTQNVKKDEEFISAIVDTGDESSCGTPIKMKFSRLVQA